MDGEEVTIRWLALVRAQLDNWCDMFERLHSIIGELYTTPECVELNRSVCKCVGSSTA